MSALAWFSASSFHNIPTAPKADTTPAALFVAIPGDADPDYVKPPTYAPEGASAGEEARCAAEVARWRASRVRR